MWAFVARVRPYSFGSALAISLNLAKKALMRFCKLTTLPPANSSAMRAYTAALLEVSGMMSNQGFELTAFLGNLRTHLEPKANFPHATLRLEDDGLVYLTNEGHRFFASRLTENPLVKGQSVSRSAVLEMARKILAASPAYGWSAVHARLQEERA
jgi:hypothetical protein